MPSRSDRPQNSLSDFRQAQAAQLIEVLDYIHHQVRVVIADAELKPRQQLIEINTSTWHQIVEIQASLAEYLERIGQPSQ